MTNIIQQIRQTILLAEGDVLVRAPIAEYLRQCGYRVVEAGNADDAKQALGNNDLGITTVLTSAMLAGDGFGSPNGPNTIGLRSTS